MHRSERADALVAPLAAVLADPPEDPFTPDVVAVPTRGVERWLAQRLSHVLGADDGVSGVCANVDFRGPRRLVEQVVADVTGVDPDDDPWRPERLAWSVLEVLDTHLGEPWAAPLARYVGEPGDEVRRGRRLTLARRVADLLVDYARQRPDVVLAWSGPTDPASRATDDGTGVVPADTVPADTVPDDLAWQPVLWRLLLDRVSGADPAARVARAVDALRADPGAVDLPPRLSVFGPTRLPEDELRVLRALAEHRDVHLWLVHPSPALWDAVAAQGPTLPTTSAVVPDGARPRRADVPPLARHPFLASTARDAVELQLRLDDAAEAHHPAPAPPATLLGALQASLRADAPDGTFAPGPDDRSVQVLACHGRARQVEVLRETLVGLFAADPTLQARDVIVLCPDVETFAPLVTATFGAVPELGEDAHPGQQLRVSLADRGAGTTNPVLALLASLLRLADGRVTASEVLDLAASAPVRRRFRFSDDEVDRLRQWAVEAGVHWGEDGGRRARFGIDARVRQGTWDAALDRVLLGAAMADEDARFVGPALPLDDVGSTDVDLAGRLAELVERLTLVLDDLDGVHPLGHWLDALDRAVTLLAEAPPTEAWQVGSARRVLGDVRAAGSAHGAVPLRLADVRAVLDDRLAGRPTRAGFRTGALTVCSLEPMRSVPHRVVCLLGMDDGVFPRTTAAAGDDLLARHPEVGERDARSEDRQIFLDAVAAAGDHLVVVHTGADERTGAARPPAVPVAELLDALDRVATAPGGGSVRDHVVTAHPLQIVDERNFTPGALGVPGAFSHDGAAFAGAVEARERTRRGQRDRVDVRPATVLVPTPLDLAAQDRAAGAGAQDTAARDVALDDVVRLLENAPRWFAQTTLDVGLVVDEDDVDDRLPLSLTGLAGWGVGDRVLRAALAGVDPGRALQAEWRRGQVPPRELGRAALQGVLQSVGPLRGVALDAAREADEAAGRPVSGDVLGSGETVDVRAPLPGGRTLVGTVPGVHGRRVVRTEYSRLVPKHRLRAWVQGLTLAVSEPGPAWDAVTVGRASRGPGVAWSTLVPPAPDLAAQVLADLVALRDEAVREPLPLLPEVSLKYVEERRASDARDALMRAGWLWNKGFERADPYVVLAWGRDPALPDVAGQATTADLARFPDDPSRLGALARRVWEPLLENEQRGAR
ncbi:exodeoxyribonuclease V subunit gamma [Cellulosimicrobium marinum]|uniref:exodeoxyribonuclease V subunit gamma n=1 Tax=Cellulosimicrobium marinum TaxID=1638992 RepID=UPI001E3D92D7|nr:exodeoxyribonuclease V subunit gamma [Cellulosimicrobium marinum]MCB7135153.1 exodeoxyribonuclease V subunit gamma [Cellulosimicrobium marinum]